MRSPWCQIYEDGFTGRKNFHYYDCSGVGTPWDDEHLKERMFSAAQLKNYEFAAKCKMELIRRTSLKVFI